MYKPTIVLTTPFGRYQWWEALELVDYVPKGKRRETDSGYAKTLDKAITTACKMEIQRIKENPNEADRLSRLGR